MSAKAEHEGDGVAPACVDRQALAELDLALEHRPLAHRRALEHVAVVVDDRGEAGRRDLADPAAALDGAHLRGRDLLGLHDRAGERRAVGGVEHEPGAVLDALAGAVGEEDLPRDRRGDPARRVRARRGGAGSSPISASRSGSASPATCSSSERNGTNSPKGTRCTLS